MAKITNRNKKEKDQKNRVGGRKASSRVGLDLIKSALDIAVTRQEKPFPLMNLIPVKAECHYSHRYA